MMDQRPGLRPRSVLLGTSAGALGMVVAAAAAAGMMAKGVADPENLGLWAAGILVGSGMLGSMTAMLGGGSALDAAAAALGELVVLIAVNLAMNQGKMEGAGVTALALAGGCGAAVLLRMGAGNGRKRRKRRRKNR